MLILLCLSLYTYLVVEVAPRTNLWQALDSPEDITPLVIVGWSCFGLLWILAVISLANMVFRSPGYVPNNYKFDQGKMNEVD